MRKKQENEVGQKQSFPIWHFIVDSDGFANSDKRFKTKWHDDLSELEDKFDSALKLARLYVPNKDYFNDKRSDYERKVNHREQQEGLAGGKYGFVEIEKVNAETFHNLLSEFYLRPSAVREITESTLNKLTSDLANKIASIHVKQPDKKQNNNVLMNYYTISNMFDYHPGNHGLTSEIIYEQQPTSDDDNIPIFSGSQDNETPIGYIHKNGTNNKGEGIAYFEGPCLILTKDGSAGLLTYKDKGEIFTVNHHACVLTLKDSWKTKLHIKWFAHQYQNRLFQVVTSKSDNKVFSTKWFERLKFEIPNDYDEQVRQWDKIEVILKLKHQLQSLNQMISKITSQTLKISY